MLHKRKFSWDQFYKVPIVGIVREISMESVLKIVQVYEEAGLTTIEITMNTPQACKIITSLRNDFDLLNIGAGTVCNLKDLDLALDAGAQFIVTPIIDEEVIRKCVSLEVPIFPGAYSPTEIYRAWSLGACMVKVFPASQLGPQFIKDIKAPMKEVQLLPTGGVTKNNINSFFKAGAAGVGMGSSLLDKNLLLNEDYEGLRNYLLSIKEAIKDLV